MMSMSLRLKLALLLLADKPLLCHGSMLLCVPWHAVHLGSPFLVHISMAAAGFDQRTARQPDSIARKLSILSFPCPDMAITTAKLPWLNVPAEADPDHHTSDITFALLAAAAALKTLLCPCPGARPQSCICLKANP